VIITLRSRPVAEIVPRRPARHESVIERGIREGWISPAVRGPGSPPKGKPVEGLIFEQLMTELDKDGEDRW